MRLRKCINCYDYHPARLFVCLDSQPVERCNGDRANKAKNYEDDLSLSFIRYINPQLLSRDWSIIYCESAAHITHIHRIPFNK